MTINTITMILIAVLLVMFLLLGILCILYFKSRNQKTDNTQKNIIC